VKTLIDKQKKEHHNSSSATLQASFDSLDARDLPYAQNSYDIVIEKGTLDAMLSDPEEGIRNCIQTVKEMARVTNVGGSILIVSHLNANEDKGMGWLEDVVFSGLKEEFKERRQVAIKKQSQSKSDSSREKETENEEGYVWSVEVHGGEGQIVEGNEEEEEEDGEITFGPAVYIIRKKSVTAAVARELYSKKRDAEKNDIDEEDDMAMPPVKVTFLTYG
jgi:SAM-dependent methyltransferase